MHQRDGRDLEQALIDVETSNARAIALGRRFVALQEEATQLRAEIARVRARHEELTLRPRKPELRPEAPSEEPAQAEPPAGRAAAKLGRWMPSLAAGERRHLKAYLDAVCGEPFVDGMTLRRQGRSTIAVAGWAFLTIPDVSVASVSLKVISARVEVVCAGKPTPREDVAIHFGRPDLALCGFTAEIPLSILRGSSARLQIEAIDSLGIVHKKTLGSLALAS